MTGEDLKRLRTNRKMSADTLAEMLGISRVTLYRYEVGGPVPPYIMYAVFYLIGHAMIIEIEKPATRKYGGGTIAPAPRKPDNVIIHKSGPKLKVGTGKTIGSYGEDYKPSL